MNRNTFRPPVIAAALAAALAVPVAVAATASAALPDPPATVLVSESFETAAPAPAFGFDRDAAVSGGMLHLTNNLPNEGVAVKKFAPAVARDSLVDVSFDWSYHGEADSKGGLEYRDRYGRLVFAMQGATKTDGTRQLRYSTTSTDSDSTSAKYAVEPTWQSVPLTVGHAYQVRVRADFTAGTVSYRIADGTTTLVEATDVPTRAAQLHRLVAMGSYRTTSNAQRIDNLVIRGRGDATPATLRGSTMYTFGDSIIAGHVYPRAGVGEFVADQEQMTVSKYAVNGAKVIDSSNDIVAQVQAAPSEDPDFVLFDGGTNDAYPATLDKLGTISQGFDGPFDTTTFAGAFEDLIAQLKAKYPTADIVYLAVAKLGARDVAVQETLRGIELDILAKWDVPVADVYTSGLDTTDDGMRVTYSFDSLQSDNGLPGTAETTGSWDSGTRPTGTHPNFPAIEEFYAPIVSQALLSTLAEYRFEAESSSPTADRPIETWNDGASGGAWNKLLATAVGNYIEYTIDVPEAGTYDLRTVYRTASVRGIAQASVNGGDVGQPYDLYAGNSSYPSVTAGTITVTEPGPVTVRYTVAGKNPASSGYSLGVDVITLSEVASAGS